MPNAVDIAVTISVASGQRAAISGGVVRLPDAEINAVHVAIEVEVTRDCCQKDFRAAVAVSLPDHAGFIYLGIAVVVAVVGQLGDDPGCSGG